MTERLLAGDAAPWFTARSSGNPRYVFDTAAGRYVILLFFGSSSNPAAATALRMVADNRRLFDDLKASFFGVSTDPADEAQARLTQQPPGIRFFCDFDLAVSRAYGALGASGDADAYQPFWLVLDPQLRVMKRFLLAESEAALRFVMALPPVDGHAGVALNAPVLVLPRLFEPEFCRHLVALYDAHGGLDSGFMREINGKTVLVTDHRHKRRSDYEITDEAVRVAARERIRRRLVPAIAQAFQFTATRMERYIVACYAADAGGHFRPHRDNTTKGTAHRRFAVTINLNAEDYDGGDLRFPEFGSRTYRAPTGGAVVFSCALLHEATPVTAGRRYAFLPFLYDDKAAALREANNQFLGEGVGAYRRTPDETAAEV